MNYELLPERGVKTNWESFNTFQNRYDCKEYKPKRKPPQTLIKAAIREFERFCEDYHIDAKCYPYVEPCEIEGEWRQFTFFDSKTKQYPSQIIVSGIISNKNGKILQRVIGI